MNSNLTEYLINLSVIVPFILVLIILSLKLGQKNLDKVQIEKYAYVIDRTNLTKDINMFVLKVGKEGCVVIVSHSSTEKIKDLSEEEVLRILEKKKKTPNFNINNNIGNKLHKKLKFNFGKDNNYGNIK